MMKRILLFVSIMFSITLLANHVYAQGLDSLDLNSTQFQFLKRIRQKNTLGSYSIQKIDPKEVKQSHNFSLNLPEVGTINFNTTKIIEHGTNYFSWFGGAELNGLGGNLIFKADKATGTIHYQNKIYKLEGLSDGLYVVYEQSDGISLPCGNSNPHGDVQIPKSDKKEIESRDHADDHECTIRILVAYTPTVERLTQENLGKDIDMHIQDLIDYSNLAYANSNTRFQIELARSVKVDYTESHDAGCQFLEWNCASLDLLRFRDKGDGYMDIIHSFRDIYDADLCILLTDEVYTKSWGGAGLIKIAGQAIGIGVDEQDGFCIVDYNENNAMSTFPHELAHLQGCRHDVSVDPSGDYNHGYYNAVEGWRTIMSYNDGCVNEGGNCTRIPYFSSPSVGHPSTGTPLGTITRENNARTLRESYNHVSHFRLTQANLPILAEEISDGERADLFAEEQITLASPFSLFPITPYFRVQSGGQATVRANNRIILKPGVRAVAGSKLAIKLESCTPPNLRVVNSEEIFTEKNSDEISNPLLNGMNLKVYPNPFHEKFTIEFQLERLSKVSINIRNLLGQLIAQPLKGESVSNGIHKYEWHAPDIPNGIYLVEVVSGDLKKVIKINKQ